ncbi:hypothetical protein HanIR_Chr08g0378601 [Helianthus annuus]|nr:hypothetical protein HanIR_Chr08g0378601 [Helianthus annuus]
MKQLFILFCPRFLPAVALIRKCFFPTLALIRKQLGKSTNLFKASSCSPLLSLFVLLKSSLLPFKLLRTLPSSFNQRLSLSSQASIFFLLAIQHLVVFHNGIRHYGTANKHGRKLVDPELAGQSASPVYFKKGAQTTRNFPASRGIGRHIIPLHNIPRGTMVIHSPVFRIGTVVEPQFRLIRLNRRPFKTRTPRSGTGSLLGGRRLVLFRIRLLLFSIRKL